MSGDTDVSQELMDAVDDGRAEDVKLWLAQAPDDDDNSLASETLLRACITGQLAIVSWLVENTSLRDNKNQELNEALWEACKKGQQVRDVVEWMVQYYVKMALPDSRQVLAEAVWLVCSNGEFDMARWMVENAPGTNVNFIPGYSNGNTLMHRVIWSGREGGKTALHTACGKRGNEEKVGELAENNAAINAQDNEGDTPLHHACHALNTDIVQLLMAVFADVSIANNDMLTPALLIKNMAKLADSAMPVAMIRNGECDRILEALDPSEKLRLSSSRRAVKTLRVAVLRYMFVKLVGYKLRRLSTRRVMRTLRVSVLLYWFVRSRSSFPAFCAAD